MIFIKVLLIMFCGLVTIWASMTDLPEDTQKHILTWCSSKSLGRLAQTCKGLQTFTNHENHERVKQIMRKELSLTNTVTRDDTVFSVSFPADGNIHSLPSTGWEEFVPTQVLNMSCNKFQNLPCTMNVMTNLEELHIADIGMSVFSQVILSFTTLTYIDLSHNCLKEIPESISNLVNLKKIYIPYNTLTHLPKSTEDLSIEELDVSFNMLKTLPKKLTLFSHDDFFYSIVTINCNPIELLQEEVFHLLDTIPIESFHLGVCTKQYAQLKESSRFHGVESRLICLKSPSCVCKMAKV